MAAVFASPTENGYVVLRVCWGTARSDGVSRPVTWSPDDGRYCGQNQELGYLVRLGDSVA